MVRGRISKGLGSMGRRMSLTQLRIPLPVVPPLEPALWEELELAEREHLEALGLDPGAEDEGDPDIFGYSALGLDDGELG